jgi:1-aminocyclopropane-1-carboxylate deaminase
MIPPFLPPAPIEQLMLPGWESFDVAVDVLRLDAWDVFRGGNKYFKLLHNVDHFLSGNFDALVTFGGAYSNHLAAFASLKSELPDKRLIAVVRGDELREESVTLKRLRALEVEIVAVDRPLYRQLRDGLVPGFFLQFGNCYVIPEGGSNAAGVQGCELIGVYCTGNYNEIMLPVATGSTMAGLILGLKNNSKVTGVAVLKGEKYLDDQLSKMIAIADEHPQSLPEYKILHDFHFGGYAKSTNELDAFVAMMRLKSTIPVEPIYTGKMFYALHSRIIRGEIPRGSHILLVHTGGMQYLATVNF